MERTHFGPITTTGQSPWPSGPAPAWAVPFRPCPRYSTLRRSFPLVHRSNAKCPSGRSGSRSRSPGSHCCFLRRRHPRSWRWSWTNWRSGSLRPPFVGHREENQPPQAVRPRKSELDPDKLKMKLFQ